MMTETQKKALDADVEPDGRMARMGGDPRVDSADSPAPVDRATRFGRGG